MSAKCGVLHDYDLLANNEPSAKSQTCAVCDSSPVAYQWSDYSGEAMCCKCGTPYQLKWGSDKQKAEGEYPYLTLNPVWVPIVREYHAETGRFVCLGMMLGPKPGMAEFHEWVTVKHPEMMRTEPDAD